ncbi:YeeE/YedE thiosulfate transporter family protein [Pelagicoccus enzymogenes]|uniref:YeeE/YedE thiosulfate transporter family protein n=1 Tax=Pelagicoccus enzymogenes TaxID=2773457 RepID=UPI00281124FD|nr:YeeE/YedE thiosulfate transporter family protein [Pelagicoccus enzymogenes]
MSRRLVCLAILATGPAATRLWGQPSELALRYGGPSWSPVLVGGLIGLLVCLSLVVVRKPIGASSAYASIAGLLGRSFSRKTLSLSYYENNPPRFDYSVVFLISVVAGSFLSAWTGGSFNPAWLPAFWVDMFGVDSGGQRFAWAFVGGLLLSFGARTAGGCTSGHGISGALQLSAASWISLACFFIGGVATARLVYPY